MARPKVDSRLQNIEDGIKKIQEKLCDMSPCEDNDAGDVTPATDETE